MFLTVEIQKWSYGPNRCCCLGKQASRKSLKPDNTRVRTRSADEDAPRGIDEPDNSVQDDPLRAREHPALEDVLDLLSSGDDAADAEDTAITSPSGRSDEVLIDETIAESEEATSSEMTTSIDQATSVDEASSQSEAVISSENVTIADETVKMHNDVADTQAVFEDADNILTISDTTPAAQSTASSPSRHEETINAEGSMIVKGDITSSIPTHFSNMSEALSSEIADVSLLPSKVSTKALTEERLVFEQPGFDSSLTSSTRAKSPKRRSPRQMPKLLSPHKETPPGASRAPKPLLSVKSLQAEYPDETPQIGTSLLRRESLRGKESPSKKRNARKSKTPKKRDTLQRRDTLQEREILQRVIAETNAVHSDENLDAPPTEIGTLPSSSSAVGAQYNVESHARGSPAAVLCEEQPNMGIITGAEAVVPAIDESKVEKDLHSTMEAIEVYEHPIIANASQARLDFTPDDTQGMEAMDKANEVLAKTELDDASQMVEATKEQTPNQRTRSGARFSDDTSLLKDFLNRAQARKAAQKPFLSASYAPIPQLSPRRSPRKTHGSQDGHVSSPRKSRSSGTRPGTPPGKTKMEALDSDEGEEVTAEPASCRRSTRTRLPAPSKPAPGAPSFIPVRRADGADPVVLQKSQAQELALTTRANTRRNKGQSKPPLQALQDLPMESADGATVARLGAETGKSVAWAAKIASYEDAKDEADDAEDRRPKVRRLRGLGAVNGTPAAKRTTAVVSTSNGTPAPKRRGRL